MARRLVLLGDGVDAVLAEVPADNEQQLQRRLRDSPELLPVEEFGVPAPLLVVGRETTLPSGAADLLLLSRTGELLIVEMKTGPQNSDFRAALAQAIDYGADLWRMTVDMFEATVAVRYFASPHCNAGFQRFTALAEAAKNVWPDQTDLEYQALRDRLAEVLTTGAFTYVIVAQRFTPSMVTTGTYLNEAVGGRARYFLVELIRFAGAHHAAFEARTVLTPSNRTATAAGTTVNETTFLDAIDDAGYRDALKHLFEASHGLGLRFEWGTAGASIRLLTPYKTEPISLAWVFPPGVSGWMGLRDVTLGFDRSQLTGAGAARPAFAEYARTIGQISSAQPTKHDYLEAFSFQPSSFTSQLNNIVEALASIANLIERS